MSSFADCPLIQSGEGSTVFHTGKAQIDFPCPMPDDNYTVVASDINPGGLAYSFATSNHTSTGFQIFSTPGRRHGFTWVAIHR